MKGDHAPGTAPRTGEYRARSTHILRRMDWSASLATGFVAALLIALFVVQQREVRWIQQSRNMVRLTRELNMLAVDRESALRALVLGGDSAAALPHAVAVQPAITRTLDSLTLLSTKDSAQHERIQSARAALDRWEREFARPALTRSTAPRDDRSLAAAVQRARTGKLLFDEVRAWLASFIAVEYRVYAEHVRRARMYQVAIVGGALAGLALVLAVLLRMRRRLTRHLTQLLDQQDLLELQAAQLEEQAQLLEEQAVELEHQVETTQGALQEVMRAQADTERAAAEKAETLALLDLVLSRAPVGLAFQDREQRIMRANPVFASIDDRSVDALLGRRVGEAFPELAGVLEPLLARVVASGEAAQNVELRRDIPGRDGAYRHWLIAAYPLRTDGGAVHGSGMIAIETTEIKRLEAQLLHAHRLEAVGRLAGGIAHDFNNILTAIASFSEFAAAELPPASQPRADIEQIRHAALRASALTRQLLAFSRRQVLQPRVLDLNAVLANVEAMLRRLIGAHITVVTMPDAALDLVEADPMQLEQVLVNLVVNARDAMPGGGELRIETRNVELDADAVRLLDDLPPGHYVRLSVTDTGIGMDAETRARIFEPFFTTKDVGSGTGLGLATVYGIVRQSGGAITVESEPGHGATFAIHLPRSLRQPSRPHAAIGALRGGEQPVDGASILIVEDEMQVRLVARRILERAGFTVIEAPNGRAALDLLASWDEPLHLVITDLIMPEMGGRELAQHLALLSPGTPLLYMSGYTADAVNRQALLDARDVFLEKPFTPDALLRKVREVLAPA